MEKQQPRIKPWQIAIRALTVVFCLFPVPHSGGESGINKPVYCLVAKEIVTFFREPAKPLVDRDGNVINFGEVK